MPCHRERFLDLVEGRQDTAGMTKMKDISLKGVQGVSGERVVNKIQDFVWDEILSEHCQLPQVRRLHSFAVVSTASENALCVFISCAHGLGYVLSHKSGTYFFTKFWFEAAWFCNENYISKEIRILASLSV